jgi:predicted  nucleic acid-binding Zn-ribbon protein
VKAATNTNNNSSPERQSPAPQTAPRARELEADQESEPDTEADKTQTVTVEKSGYQIRPVFGGPFSNFSRKAWEPIKQQPQETSTQQGQPQKAAETKPQTAANTTQTSLGSRLGGYTQNRRQPERDTEALVAAQVAAKDALAATNDFRTTQGAALLNKINDAAATTKGGIREVLSEMRTNGAYEDLRKEFDTLYTQNASFRDSYDRAANTLAEYGEKRGAVTATIQSQPQNPLAGKIKALDEEIAKATADIPGATEGQSITEKLAEKAREIVDAILEKLRKTFDSTHDPSPSPAPSPSP